MSCCYCWLHPCTPHCPLHKPVPCLAAIVDCIHAHHIVHYISTQCHVLLLLLTAPMHTSLSTTHISTVPCLAAIVDCIHAHHIVHYISQCHVLLLLLTASMHATLSTTHIKHMTCLAAIVDCIPMHTTLSTTHINTVPSLAAIVDCIPYTPHCPLHISTQCHVLLLLLTVPMHTTLSTTHINTVPCLAAIVDCTHIHHLVHYTYQHSAMSCCYCWLHPYTPHCPLHISAQCHVLLLLLTAPIYTTLSTTHINTVPCLVAIVDYTHIHHIVHYTYQHSAMSCCYCWLHTHIHHIVHYTYQHSAMSCCYCWLYPYTPHCPLHISAMSCCYCWLHPCTPHCPLHKPVPCLVAIVDCIHAHHIVHYISQCHVLLLLLTAPLHTTLSTT